MTETWVMEKALIGLVACESKRHTAENIKKWTEEALKDIGLTAANLVEEVEDEESEVRSQGQPGPRASTAMASCVGEGPRGVATFTLYGLTFIECLFKPLNVFRV